MQKEYKLTKERLEELKVELEFLKTVREKEVADLIKEARSFGDLSENSEYDEAKNEQGKLYSRIAEIENIITYAKVIIESEVPGDTVHHGAKVVIEFLDDGSREEYLIVGTQEANPAMGRLSDESPVGRALLGKKVGNEVQIEAPGGVMHCRIVQVS